MGVWTADRSWDSALMRCTWRSGTARRVDREAALDIARSELEYYPLHAEARELAEASLADDDEARLASAAAAFLDACGYEPGFEQAPERFARLARALDAVRADMRTTGWFWRPAGDRADRGGQAGPAGLVPRQRSRRDVGGRPGVDERNFPFRCRRRPLGAGRGGRAGSPGDHGVAGVPVHGEGVACLPGARGGDVTGGAPRHRGLVVRRR